MKTMITRPTSTSSPFINSPTFLSLARIILTLDGSFSRQEGSRRTDAGGRLDSPFSEKIDKSLFKEIDFEWKLVSESVVSRRVILAKLNILDKIFRNMLCGFFCFLGSFSLARFFRFKFNFKFFNLVWLSFNLARKSPLNLRLEDTIVRCPDDTDVSLFPALSSDFWDEYSLPTEDSLPRRLRVAEQSQCSGWKMLF